MTASFASTRVTRDALTLSMEGKHRHFRALVRAILANADNLEVTANTLKHDLTMIVGQARQQRLTTGDTNDHRTAA